MEPVRAGLRGAQTAAKNTLRGYGIVRSMTEVAVAVDEQVRGNALRRLSIIEGQVRGLRRMVEERLGCVEVLTQISAIHEALRGVGKVIVRHHIETCVTDGLQTDEPADPGRAHGSDLQAEQVRSR